MNELFKIHNVVSLNKDYCLSNYKLKKFQFMVNFLLVLISLSTIIANSFSFVLIISLFFLLSLILIFNKVIHKIRLKLEQPLFIREQLLMILRTNKLFTTMNNEGQIKIIRSAILSFLIKDDRIIIRAHLTGDSFSKTLKEGIDLQLSSALGLELEEKKNPSPQIVDYIFLKDKKEVNQIIFSPNQFDRTFFESVSLDTIKLTNHQSFSLKKSSMLGLYGRTGTGKTIGLQWYLYHAVAKGSGIFSDSILSIVDGKGADLYALGSILQDEIPNVYIGQTPHDLAKLSRKFVESMDGTFELIKENTALNADAYDLGRTPSFLFIDELASIRDSCGNSKQGKSLWEEILQNLGLIARKGRQASHHLVLSTQDPNSDNIPVELRNQITSVLFLGNPSNDRIKMAFSMCELENVPTVSGRKGEALFYADGNNMIEPEITIIPFVDVKTKQDFRHVINKIKPDPNNFI